MAGLRHSRDPRTIINFFNGDEFELAAELNAEHDTEHNAEHNAEHDYSLPPDITVEKLEMGTFMDFETWADQLQESTQDHKSPDRAK
jgi:hypothetical protein